MTISPSTGDYQMDLDDYNTMVKQIHYAVENSGLSAEDQAVLLAKPISLHLETALEVTFDDLTNSLVFMPGDYVIDNNRVINFNIGVVQ